MGFLWYFHPREWCNLIIIKPMPLLTPSPFCWSLLSPQVYTLTLSCLCACVRDPIGLIGLLPRCSDLVLRNGIGFWETAMDKHSKGKSRLGVCGTPWVPFSNAFDGISPDGRPLKSMNCPMTSWAEEQVLFFYLFTYFLFVFEWQAPHSDAWCQLQLGMSWAWILYELTRDPLSKLLVPSESQLDAVCRGPKTPCFPSEPTAAMELDSGGCQGTCFAWGHSRLAFSWRPSS